MANDVSAHGSMRQWRNKILGAPDNGIPRDADALNDACWAWLDIVQRIFSDAADGKVVVEPPALSRMTYLLTCVADVGPTSIDPAPLTYCLTRVQRLRLRQQSRFAPDLPASDVCEEEIRALDIEIVNAIPVLNRLTHAWVALEGGEPPHPVGGIPSEFRTVGMTKKKAASYLRTGNPDSAVEWLNKCIEEGTISCESLSRQTHVFDVRQFPNLVQAQIRDA